MPYSNTEGAVTEVLENDRERAQMKKTSIFKQLLLPIIAIVCTLAVCLIGVVVFIFVKSYEQEIYPKIPVKSVS